MRDLEPIELGHVYGAGGYSKCKPPKKHKAKKGGSSSRGSKSNGSGHYKGKGSS